jgi:hypothetical protein
MRLPVFFYSREGNEPPHVHVTKGECEAKYWLNPVALVWNEGFSGRDIRVITEIVSHHCKALEKSYKEFHEHSADPDRN